MREAVPLLESDESIEMYAWQLGNVRTYYSIVSRNAVGYYMALCNTCLLCCFFNPEQTSEELEHPSLETITCLFCHGDLMLCITSSLQPACGFLGLTCISTIIWT